jgi:predicted ribosomally synthesized peptide with SipW-like signal peptide
MTVAAMRRTSIKLLSTAAVLGLVGLLAGVGTWSAFSSTTANDGNSFASGTVVLGDDDSGSAMFNVSGMVPGSTQAACLKVTYTGTVPSGVRLYGTTTGTGLDQYLDVKVTRGTKSGGGGLSDCSTFAADATDYTGGGAGVVYAGTLQDYPDAWGAGVVDAPGAAESWTEHEVHAYRIDVTLRSTAPNAAQGKTATQSFVWEAQNS